MTGLLIITRGLPASGKSQWARQQVDDLPAGEVVRLNRDDLRAMLLPSSYREPEYRAEQIVTQVQHGQITQLLADGVMVIVDDTNLRMRTARDLVRLAEKANAGWECVDHFLDVPVEECIRRDAARERTVGEEVIRRMWRKYLSGGRRLPLPTLETPVVGKPYIPPDDGIPAVMIDIDGTVAEGEGIRDPYDTSRYHLDAPCQPVIEAVWQEYHAGHKLIFCSGRSDEFRAVTQEWINKHVFGDMCVSYELYMRAAGDTRNDAIVKLELFDRHIRDKYDVRRCYDDRDRVVSAYRSIGLKVFQVAPGDF